MICGNIGEDCRRPGIQGVEYRRPGFDILVFVLRDWAKSCIILV